ncbi:MAG: hypothetical protein AAGF11_01690 [Myxococcota bacterium]
MPRSSPDEPREAPTDTPANAPADTQAPSPARTWIPVAGLYAALAAYLLVREIGVPIYDDGYFFKRFALHALEHGVYAWNLEDGAVYGCTSQIFQLLATLAAAITHTHYVVAIKVLCALSLAALGALLMRWCTLAAHSHRGSLIALLALGSPLVLTTVLTGMETASTLLGLAAVLMAMVGPEGHRALSARWAALLTVLVYLCRPDIALVPVVVYVVPSLLRREFPSRFLGTLAGAMLVTLVGLGLYYGTPLPLSFFMKTLGLQPYGDELFALGRADKQIHFGATVAFATPLVYLAMHRRDPTNLALLAATGALWAYHLTMTNEIMGYRARFYVPGLVPLCMAAARSDEAFRDRGHRRATLGLLVGLAAAIAVAYARDWIPTPRSDYLGRLAMPSYAGAVASAGWLLLPRSWSRPRLDLSIMGLLAIASVLGWKRPVQFQVRSDAALMRVHARQVTTVRGIFDVARCLPEAKTVYHSEMGVPGLVLWRTRVVDLAGILSDHLVYGESFETICERDRPEAIFLPHRNYRRLNAEIRRSPCFASYRKVVDHSASPLHIREDLVEPFLGCATDVQRWQER